MPQIFYILSNELYAGQNYINTNAITNLLSQKQSQKKDGTLNRCKKQMLRHRISHSVYRFELNVGK